MAIIVSFQPKNCRGVSHTPSYGRTCPSIEAGIFIADIQYRSREGRMRYAPTHVRSK